MVSKKFKGKKASNTHSSIWCSYWEHNSCNLAVISNSFSTYCTNFMQLDKNNNRCSLDFLIQSFSLHPRGFWPFCSTYSEGQKLNPKVERDTHKTLKRYTIQTISSLTEKGHQLLERKWWVPSNYKCLFIES